MTYPSFFYFVTNLKYINILNYTPLEKDNGKINFISALPDNVKNNLIIKMKNCNLINVTYNQIKQCCDEYQIVNLDEGKCDIPTTIPTIPSPSPLPSEKKNSSGLSNAAVVGIAIPLVLILQVVYSICL